jgi:hypothetical protein
MHFVHKQCVVNRKHILSWIRMTEEDSVVSLYVEVLESITVRNLFII